MSELAATHASTASTAVQPRSTQCVVLGSHLRETDTQRFEQLFAAFEAGYRHAFHGDEAESTAEWRARIAGEKQSPQPLMRVVVAILRGNDQSERVIGGLALEYYRTSAVVLATYLYVDPLFRNAGTGRSLIQAASAVFSDIGPTKALVAESEWPEELLAGYLAGSEPGARELVRSQLEEISVARDRLAFFARVGARLVHVDYVQPALGPGKRPVSCLRLLLLPQVGKTVQHVGDDAVGSAIAAFLEEFYEALAQEGGGPPDRVTLSRMRAQCLAGDGARRPLTSLLPRLRVTDAALCFHFVQPLTGSATDSVAGSELLQALRNYDCPVLHSMETDLLSRAYRDPDVRPLRSVCVTKPQSGQESGFLVEVAFPEFISFQSEARDERRYWPLRRRRLRAFLSFTALFEAQLLVWHLTLRVDRVQAEQDARYWLDEVDLIALQKLADDSANQERVFVTRIGIESRRLNQAIEFSLPRADEFPGDEPSRPAVLSPMDLDGLLRAVGSVAQRRCREIAAATYSDPLQIEREVPPLPDPRPANAVTLQILGRAPQHLQSPFEWEAICGVITCIFDFDEIDESEIKDTLAPSVSIDDALLRVHRVAVFHMALDDRATRTVAASVGISPYLLVPQAVIVANESVMKEAERVMRDNRRSVIAFWRKVELLEGALRERWMPNVFFYPTEKELLDRGLQFGGVTARRDRLEELLRKAKTDLQQARDQKREQFEAAVAGLLAGISVLSVDLARSLAASMLDSLGFLAADAEQRGNVGVALLAGAVGVFVWWIKSRNPNDS